MIPDTDEELEIWLRKNGWIISRETIKQLRALINHYIAKDRAQGQEPYGYLWFDKNMEQRFSSMWPPITGETVIGAHTPIYIHARPNIDISQEPFGYVAISGNFEAFSRKKNSLNGMGEITPVYTHTQPIAEIQAEALEKAASELVGKTILLSEGAGVRNAHSRLINKAAKLRKGEPL